MTKTKYKGTPQIALYFQIRKWTLMKQRDSKNIVIVIKKRTMCITFYHIRDISKNIDINFFTWKSYRISTFIPKNEIFFKKKKKKLLNFGDIFVRKIKR